MGQHLTDRQKRLIADQARARHLVVDDPDPAIVASAVVCMAGGGNQEAQHIVDLVVGRDLVRVGPGDASSAAKLPRVGIVSPSLTLGGAEGWIRDLVTSDVDGLTWSGVAATGPDVTLDLVHQLTPEIPVLLGPRAPGVLAGVSDVLLVWGIKGFGGYLPAGRPSRRPILVGVSHGGGPWARHLLADVGQWADHLVGVSRPALSAFPGDRQGVVLWNGIDLDRIATEAASGDVRRSWGVSDRDKIVLYVGRFSPEKTPWEVCKATAALGRGWRPVLVGGGWKDKETRAAASRADPRAIFPGTVDTPGAALAAADCFALLSPSEGFSLAMIEAWLAGVPVVATPVGAVDELEERFGPMVWRAPVGDPQAAAAAIRSATSKVGRRRADRAREIAKKHLTRAAMVDRWRRFLLEITA